MNGLPLFLSPETKISLRDGSSFWDTYDFRSLSVIRKTMTPKGVRDFDVYENIDADDKEIWHDGAVETFRASIDDVIKTGVEDGLNESEIRAFLQASVGRVKLLEEEVRGDLN